MASYLRDRGGDGPFQESRVVGSRDRRVKVTRTQTREIRNAHIVWRQALADPDKIMAAPERGVGAEMEHGRFWVRSGVAGELSLG